jgi:hypothetical protein
MYFCCLFNHNTHKMKIHNRIGEKHFTNEGLEVEIIEYNSATDCTVRYKDGYILKGKYYLDVKQGKIKNPYYPKLYNIGYIGEGDYTTIKNKIRSKSYLIWTDMIKRCYDTSIHLTRKSYINCTVDKEWHNFQNFAKWFDENYINDYCLDKDILIKGNRLYSKTTCCFVPNDINILLASSIKKDRSLPLGVVKHKEGYRAQMSLKGKTTYLGVSKNLETAFMFYKKAKEDYIKKIAFEYYNSEKIEFKVYNSLYNYKIEIID